MDHDGDFAAIFWSALDEVISSQVSLQSHILITIKSCHLPFYSIDYESKQACATPAQFHILALFSHPIQPCPWSYYPFDNWN